jgi:hypothetical protein
MCSILRSTYPVILKLIWVPNLELLPFFSSNFQNGINILKIWWKKGNNFKMGNQIYFKIVG